ncbi:prolyl aminopeptidase [Corynebacterium sp. MC-04]|uniref:Proline iminopeptidase n=1 Tax=Corynebacterium parakroppenstedtii TaxID=2828363 RepID=A0ABS9HL05_9CORY|nr:MULTISPECIES: prolyl aminopeptidase [Corynebacterium]KXB50310.1 prolyl aminopeptidase [Corynebacterium kroppenstedtii]MBY0788968.1 prolyl aminopeptidase [Corynebacterium parakroppenstedtii]MBY0793031.1 prolyl aminopeptidase [Corynebacterium parakroppenstedtii]MBY0797819.1 prolyl aminopeptidase [Corynebacterium parakroppenstedtii]MCF6769535.1 prolyl aminopeptidase [Corynebacterium parakroppenstedtii]
MNSHDVQIAIVQKGLYSETAPFNEGTVERPVDPDSPASTQHIAYAEYGNPEGIPAVFIHGGPGGGTSAKEARFFNPDKYRIILIDQRGCGRSTPHLADPDTNIDAELSVNTTSELIGDIEAIREALGIEKWVVFGGSWGSTLSLAYTQAHPERTLAIILRGIFMLRRTELDWYYNGGAAYMFPDKWERFLSVIPDDKKPDPLNSAGMTHLTDVNLIDVYHELLRSDDHDTAVAAARAWSVWEGSTSYLHDQPTDTHEDERFALAFARIENHYFVNHGFLEEGQLLRDVDKIREIPAVIAQGRYDVVCPPITAWQLHQAWPEATFVWSPTSGHASYEEETTSTLVSATDKFAETFAS